MCDLFNKHKCITYRKLKKKIHKMRNQVDRYLV
jgi:hypothetical protein